ncbi:MAG: hypothetical protein ABL997_02030 [Planctomycetota bacterium]
MRRSSLCFLLLAFAACSSANVGWSTDATGTLRSARAAGRDVAVFFHLKGREQSDRMVAVALSDREVERALADGDFAALQLDGFAHQRLYGTWIGGGEGMGLCVLDGSGRVYASRPGPQDPPEVAAFLRRCAAEREALAKLRSDHALLPEDGKTNLALGSLLLELGCRVDSEPMLLLAAQRGELEAHHRLARLFALDGMCQRARQWLRTAPPSPQADVTLGYVLFKERRYSESAAVLVGPAARRDLGDDGLRARLYLGKSLHECGRDQEARALFESLLGEAKGTTFGAAAAHSLTHLDDTNHGHTH